jgi:signal-transduction protein with cAMP-binding, CBS, and nucleotidyltransferase domain
MRACKLLGHSWVVTRAESTSPGVCRRCGAQQDRGRPRGRVHRASQRERQRAPASTKVGQLTESQSEAVTIGADDSVEEALRTMADHQVRRLPVIDGTDMVGIVAQADLARACPPEKVGELLEAISS